jgi:predicted membrane protein
MDWFRIIITAVAIVFVFVGYIGISIRQKNPKTTNKEYEEQIAEQEKELARRAKEDKELDDFFGRVNSDEYADSYSTESSEQYY